MLLGKMVVQDLLGHKVLAVSLVLWDSLDLRVPMVNLAKLVRKDWLVLLV